jgi:hypothetical protein
MVYATNRADLPMTLQTVLETYSEVNTDPILASDADNDYLLFTAGPSGLPQQRIKYVVMPKGAVCDDGNFEPTKGEVCEGLNCTGCLVCDPGYEADATSGVCNEIPPVCGNGIVEGTEVCDDPNCTDCLSCAPGFYDVSGVCVLDQPEVLDDPDMSDASDASDATQGEVDVLSDAPDATQDEVDGITETDQTIILNCADKVANVIQTVTPGCEPVICNSDSEGSLTIEVAPTIDLSKCEYTIHNVVGKEGIPATLTFTAMAEAPLGGTIKLIGTVDSDGVFQFIQGPKTISDYGTEVYADESGHGITPTFVTPLGTAELVASASKMGVYVEEMSNGDIIWHGTNQTEDGLVETVLTASTGQEVIFTMPIMARNKYFDINLSQEFRNLTGERPDNSAEFLTDVSGPDAGADTTGIPVEGSVKGPGEGCCTQVPGNGNPDLPTGTLFMLGGLAIVSVSMRRKRGSADREHRKISPFVAIKDKFKEFLKRLV